MAYFKMNTGTKKHDWDAAWLIYLAGGTLEEVSEGTGIPYRDVLKKAQAKAWSANRAAAKRVATKDIETKLATRIKSARVKHANFVLDVLDEVEEKLVESKLGEIDPEDEKGKRRVTMDKKLDILSKHNAIARQTLGMDKEEEKRDPTKDGFMFLVGMQRAMQQNRGSLVNEKPEPKQLTQSQTEENEGVIEGEYEPVSPILHTPKVTENTSSAMSPLPEDSEANTGILRPFNGHINGLDTHTETPQESEDSQESHTNGATQLKSLPDKLIL